MGRTNRKNRYDLPERRMNPAGDQPAHAAARTLLLDAAGLPIEWISWMEAVKIIASGETAWTYGTSLSVARGGVQRTGLQSTIEVPSVLAKARARAGDLLGKAPPLTNALLFARDRNICMYCGEVFPRAQLSRDHIVPRSQGGEDTYTNTVCCCLRCNHRKGARRPEQVGMELLAVPYEPNHAEGLILGNRRVLFDQAEFLLCHVPASRRARLAGIVEAGVRHAR